MKKMLEVFTDFLIVLAKILSNDSLFNRFVILMIAVFGIGCFLFYSLGVAANAVFMIIIVIFFLGLTFLFLDAFKRRVPKA